MGVKKKNTEDKHRRQSHEHTDTVRSRQKSSCARISNMKIRNMKGERISKYKKALREREMNPKRLPVRSPKINKKSTGVIANAHNECMRVQRIRKSQRQRNKVPRV